MIIIIIIIVIIIIIIDNIIIIIILDVEQGGHTFARSWKMNQNLPENQFKQMISLRDELRNEGEHLQQQQNGVDVE